MPMSTDSRRVHPVSSCLGNLVATWLTGVRAVSVASAHGALARCAGRANSAPERGSNGWHGQTALSVEGSQTASQP